jgi:hypothetical protein
MKVIIAGSRDICDYDLVVKAIVASKFEITEVVSGCCRGVDMLGEEWARKWEVPIVRFPADWAAYGKSAGYIRNNQMAKYVGSEGGLIAITNGSRGTANMISIAHKLKLEVFVLEI